MSIYFSSATCRRRRMTTRSSPGTRRGRRMTTRSSPGTRRGRRMTTRSSPGTRRGRRTTARSSPGTRRGRRTTTRSSPGTRREMKTPTCFYSPCFLPSDSRRTLTAFRCASRCSWAAIVRIVSPKWAIPSGVISWNVIFLMKLSRFTPL